MPDPVVVEQTPPAQAQPVQTPPAEQPEPQKVDLITRVSQVKVEAKPEVKTEDGKFNINDLDAEIEKIPDPSLKSQFTEFKKSLLRGENQKYQEVANLRKQYEQKLAESSSWTIDRLKQEMNRPDFVQAANQILQSQAPQGSGMSNEQWSALSDTDKAEFNQLKQKIDILERTNWETLKTQQDAQLSQKYANYDAGAVARLTDDLVSHRVQATQEHLWKVIDYENAVNRAYELGLQDKNNFNQERVAGMTMPGGNNMTQPQTIDRLKGETVQAFFKRAYTERTKK